MCKAAEQTQRGDSGIEVDARYPRSAHCKSECAEETHSRASLPFSFEGGGAEAAHLSVDILPGWQTDHQRAIGPPVVNGQFVAVGYQWCRDRSYSLTRVQGVSCLVDQKGFPF